MAESSPQGTLATVTRNAGAVLLARLLSILVRLFAISLIASYLGPGGFGTYSYVVAFAEIFAVLSDFGIIRIGVREISRDRTSIGEQFGNVLALKGLLSLATIGVVLLLAWATRVEPSLRTGILVYALATVINYYANSYFVIFRAFERMEYEAGLITLERLLYLVLAAVAVRADWGLLGIFGANLVSSIVKMAVAPWITHFSLVKLRVRLKLDSLRRYFLESLPIGLAMFLSSVYLRVDILILKQLRSDFEMGIFAGATRIIDATLILPVVMVSALFPVLARRVVSSDDDRKQVMSQSFRAMFLSAFPIALGLFVWAEPLIRWGLDESFIESIFSLRLLTVALVLSYPNFLCNHLMTALGKQISYALVVAAGLALNALSAWLLIPSMGHLGAVAATLLGETFVFAAGAFLLHRYTGYRVLEQAWRPTLVVAAIGGVFYLIRSWPLVLSSAIIATLYLGGLVLLRAVSVDEVRAAWNSIRQALRSRLHRAADPPSLGIAEARKDKEPACPQKTP